MRSGEKLQRSQKSHRLKQRRSWQKPKRRSEGEDFPPWRDGEDCPPLSSLVRISHHGKEAAEDFPAELRDRPAEKKRFVGSSTA